MAEHKIKEYIKNYRIKDHSLGMAFIALFVIATIVGWPNFLKVRNLTNILRQVSYTGIIGLGMTFVIISGGIDLSVGSMAAFVGGVSIFFLNLFGPDSTLALVLTFFFALVFGSLLGALNGVMVAKFRMAPFIVTLGTMSIFRSLIQYFSNAGTILSVNMGFGTLGSSMFLGLPIPVWFFIIIGVSLHVILNHTSFGRYLCATGANEQVARYSAIKVSLVKFVPYVITGFTVGVTAIMWSSRLNCINPSDCAGYEMDAIAAAVIGGTLMSGGKGSIIGTMMGAVMLGIINNMLVMGGISAFLQQAVRGFVIIVAVLLQYNSDSNK